MSSTIFSNLTNRRVFKNRALHHIRTISIPRILIKVKHFDNYFFIAYKTKNPKRLSSLGALWFRDELFYTFGTPLLFSIA
jgi:hypothetical protein